MGAYVKNYKDALNNYESDSDASVNTDQYFGHLENLFECFMAEADGLFKELHAKNEILVRYSKYNEHITHTIAQLSSKIVSLFYLRFCFYSFKK